MELDNEKVPAADTSAQEQSDETVKTKETNPSDTKEDEPSAIPNVNSKLKGWLIFLLVDVCLYSI